MGDLYDTDILAWSNEQAALLRARRLSELDLDNIAEEIEDVGKSVKRELRSRLAVLIAHLLKWAYQPERRSKSWVASIRVQRRDIARQLRETPSLKPVLADRDWMQGAWDEALVRSYRETQLQDFPDEPIWSMEQIRDHDFFPD